MKISWTTKRDNPGTESRVRQIVIDLNPADDPDGHLAGLLVRGRLEAFLRAYPQPGTHGSPASAGDAYDLLSRFAFVAEMCQARLEGMQLAARDQWGMSWRTIAAAVEGKTTTVKRQILKQRGETAALGYWYDVDGLHTGTVYQAADAFDGAVRQDDDEIQDDDD